MPKQKFCQRIYSLNSYRRAYAKEPYNVLRGVTVDGVLQDVPVTDVSFTRKIPSHAFFLGYFDRLHFDVPAKEGHPHEGENRPVDIPFSTLCSVWADPAEMSVYVVSDKSPEETAPLLYGGMTKSFRWSPPTGRLWLTTRGATSCGNTRSGSKTTGLTLPRGSIK